MTTPRSIASTCAVPRNTAPATGPASSPRPAGNWCRRPTPSSPCAAPASCSPTATACAPAPPRRGSIRMGFPNVYVLDEHAPAASVEVGDAPETVLGLGAAEAKTVTADELATLLKRGDVVVVDVATSRQYRAGHIPGAWFAVRGRLAGGRRQAAQGGALCAHLAGRGDRPPRHCRAGGGHGQAGRPAARRHAGLVGRRPSAGDAAPNTSPRAPTTCCLKAFERRDQKEAAMREYLQWEVGLVEQVRRDGTLQFRL